VGRAGIPRRTRARRGLRLAHLARGAHAAYEQFLTDRFHDFGPYEDALACEHLFLFHSVLTPGLNVGLVSPEHLLRRALEVGEQDGVPLASLEGFVRQLIGWREYMRSCYHPWGPQMRTSNRLEHARPLAPGWWTAQTGLDPVDQVIEGVLERGYAHHIERLMVLGNAMCLLRAEPDAVYEWFMEMFVDAYDWVMVPIVYAMSQFAAGEAVTTKPYVSGSNYLRRMSDVPAGPWTADWDGLYWAFVHDHREVFEANPRSRMMTRLWDGFEDDRQAEHLERTRPWLQSDADARAGAAARPADAGLGRAGRGGAAGRRPAHPGRARRRHQHTARHAALRGPDERAGRGGAGRLPAGACGRGATGVPAQDRVDTAHHARPPDAG
jgi:deoxyribodipyrimidine photolyase-like uncharacterized protein